MKAYIPCTVNDFDKLWRSSIMSGATNLVKSFVEIGRRWKMEFSVSSLIGAWRGDISLIPPSTVYSNEISYPSSIITTGKWYFEVPTWPEILFLSISIFIQTCCLTISKAICLRSANWVYSSSSDCFKDAASHDSCRYRLLVCSCSLGKRRWCSPRN